MSMQNHLDKLYSAVSQLGGKLYYVGGYVRDTLMGISPKDIDLLVTGLTESELDSAIQNFNFELVGSSFAVRKVKIDGVEIDLALARIEKSTGDKHTEFQFETNKQITVYDDLKRRDFTINSMAMEFDTKKLIDPFGGVKDIKKTIIRKVNENSIKEDYLRTLRGIQFSSRFNFYIEKSTLADMIKYLSQFHSLSIERIQTEFNKILLSDNVRSGINYLRHIGILDIILPKLVELDCEKYNWMYHKFNSYHHTIETIERSPKDLIVRLTMLLHDIAKTDTAISDEVLPTIFHSPKHDVFGSEYAKHWLKNMKYSNEIINAVGLLVENHNIDNFNFTTKHMRKIYSKLGRDLTEKLLYVNLSDKGTTISSKFDFDNMKLMLDTIILNDDAIKVTDLKINGHDLLNLGYKGKEIGDALKYLLDLVIDTPGLNNKSALLSILNERSKYEFRTL